MPTSRSGRLVGSRATKSPPVNGAPSTIPAPTTTNADGSLHAQAPHAAIVTSHATGFELSPQSVATSTSLGSIAWPAAGGSAAAALAHYVEVSGLLPPPMLHAAGPPHADHLPDDAQTDSEWASSLSANQADLHGMTSGQFQAADHAHVQLPVPQHFHAPGMPTQSLGAQFASQPQLSPAGRIMPMASMSVSGMVTPPCGPR